MITAEQARERSLEALLEQRETQFKEIAKGIEAESAAGMYYYHVDGALYPENQAKLEALGYEVSIFDQYGVTDYTISWHQGGV